MVTFSTNSGIFHYILRYLLNGCSRAYQWYTSELTSDVYKPNSCEIQKPYIHTALFSLLFCAIIVIYITSKCATNLTVQC